ncbi:MAG: FIST C-terminal domain-containing protein [Phycisphaerales bacterium]|nr:FIST C-terminal domain-containing protein [Phycisphaerales bacterium]
MEVATALEKDLQGATPAALILLGSFHHASALTLVAGTIRDQIQPGSMISGTAQTVFSGLRAPERRSGLVGFVLEGDGLQARAFIRDWHRGPAELTTPEEWSTMASTGADHAATILLADPFSTDPRPVLQAIDQALPGPVGGGLLSGSTRPGGNVLIADDEHASTGLVGLGLGGPIRCGTLVSQGCRPIGQRMIVTGVHESAVMSLGGRPATDAARETIMGLNQSDRDLVANGLRLGVAVTEYREHFGPHDYLVREITGVDEQTGALRVAERPSVGQSVQFLIRDPASADSDLDLALDAASLDEAPPFGLLLAESGVRAGTESDLERLNARLGDLPTAGMICAGEFARGRDRSVVHGASASALIFRAKEG